MSDLISTKLKAAAVTAADAPTGVDVVLLADALRIVAAEPGICRGDGGQCGVGGYCSDCPAPSQQLTSEVPQELARRWDENYFTARVVKQTRAQFIAQCAIEWDRQNRLVPASTLASEDHAFQLYRTKPAWSETWGSWTECSREQAADYERNPTVNDWQREVRRLYASPQVPTPKALTDEEIATIYESSVAIGWPLPQTAFDFARAIERKLQEQQP